MEQIFSYTRADASGRAYHYVKVFRVGGEWFAGYGTGNDGWAYHDLGFQDPDMARVMIPEEAAEKIRAVLEDVSLCVLEDVSVINGSTRLRGCRQTFEFDNRGRHVKAYGSDLQACGDAEHCPQAWFLACALEKVRKILVPLGVPRKCFRL